MKLPVKYESTFKVDKANRVVICTLHAWWDFGESHYDYCSLLRFLDNLSGRDDFNRMRIVRKARCLPSDQFDEKLGKKIALSKARVALYNRAYKALLNSIKAISTFCSPYTDIQRAIENSIRSENNYLKKLTHGSDN
jgi:hypothetical protein